MCGLSLVRTQPSSGQTYAHPAPQAESPRRPALVCPWPSPRGGQCGTRLRVGAAEHEWKETEKKATAVPGMEGTRRTGALGPARVRPGRAVLLREALESGGHHPQPPRSARTGSPPCMGHQPFLYKMSPMVTSEAWDVQGEERGRRQRVLILTPERASRAARQPRRVLDGFPRRSQGACCAGCYPLNSFLPFSAHTWCPGRG